MATAAHQLTPEEASAHPPPRSRRRPLRRRQRRRHAADRRPVHAVDRAGRQRPCDLPRFSGRDPRAAGHDCSASRRSRSISARPQIDTAGDAARRARRDEPGGAQDQCPALEARRADHRRRGRVHASATSTRPSTSQSRSRTAASRKWQLLAFDICALTLDAVKPFGLGNKEALRCKNMWTLGLALWMFDRDRQPLDRLAQGQVRQEARAGRGQHRRAQRRPCLWRDRRDRRAGAAASHRRRAGRAGPLPHRHRRRIDLGRAWSPARSWPGCRCSSAAIRSPRPRRSCTTWRASRNSASPPSRPRTRSPRSAPRSARPMPASSGVTSSSGPGIALKGEAMGLAIMTELPLVIVNSQRGGPSTGLADQDRAERPLPGGLWPQRRCADAGHRRALARRCVRLRDRGGAHRHALHDPGDAADRRLYRQCRRAVEGARHERLCAVPGQLPRTRRPKGEGGACPTPATRSLRGHGSSPARPA